MNRGAMIAIIAGIAAAAAIAGVFAFMMTPDEAPDGGPLDYTGTGGGRNITIELNEDLGLQEETP